MIRDKLKAMGLHEVDCLRCGGTGRALKAADFRVGGLDPTAAPETVHVERGDPCVACGGGGKQWSTARH